MKIIILVLALLISSISFAHKFPDANGQCLFMKKNSVFKERMCLVSTGGGAGGSYISLKVSKKKVLIEISESGDVSVGENVEKLKDGVIYYRDLDSKEIVDIKQARMSGSYLCAKQLKGSIDICYVLID